jgi:hypothetical protein
MRNRRTTFRKLDATPGKRKTSRSEKPLMTTINTLSPDIDKHIALLGSLTRLHVALLTCLKNQLPPLVEILMANAADLQATIDGLKEVIVADQAADQQVVDKLDALVLDLTEQLAAADVDTQPFIDQLDAIKALVVPAHSSTPAPQVPPGETEVPPSTP